MTTRVFAPLLAILILLGACRPPLEMGMQSASGEPSACVPYGSLVQSPYVGDPPLDETPIPTSESAIVPTCEPLPTEPAQGPTPTPFPTAVPVDQQSSGGGATAPQNVSLSPGSQRVGRLVAHNGTYALTWRGTRSHLLVGAESGHVSYVVADVLGVDGPAAVALSPFGRLHLYAAGRYAYTDGAGGDWSVPTSAPSGGDPHLVVGSDGLARLLLRDHSSLVLYTQTPVGAWDGPESLAGGVADYAAVRAGEHVIVAATGVQTTIHRIPGGLAAQLDGGDRVNLTYRMGEILLGIGRHSGSATIARSLDGGAEWSTCLVQQSQHTVESVGAFPTTKGPYAALWTWHQPDGPLGVFRYIVLSTVHWPIGGGCAVWPEQGMVDSLAGDQVQRIAAPGLVFSRAQQGDFRIGDDGSVLAYNGRDLSADSTDVFLVNLRPDAVFSGSSQGFGQLGEGAP
jgi:hypothetical protein